MRKWALYCCFAAALLSSFWLADPAAAQYFGRNKVQYDDFNFEVLSTDRFDIHFYPEEEVAVKDAARMAERWYRRHSRSFLREFIEKKPIIFYANDADFHQTNVVGGFIGEGTGGVTEGLKQRVTMPLTGSYRENDHVLGHELVHSFQYDIAFSGDGDSSRFNLGLLPLWLVEGMAEYLSIGREDPHTAMWLRDAALRNHLPTIKQLATDPTFFPYRYGQAYMAYIGGKYGDGAVTSIYKLAGRAGLDSAIVYTIGITPDSLSKEWIQVVKDTYMPLMAGRVAPDSAGRSVISEKSGAGKMNISPTISPDGKYIAFLSEKDLFNINLFIADAETGKIVKKLLSMNRDAHFDALRFINSAGTWSPDGKRLAFITFAQGDNEIAIFNVDAGDVERRIHVQGVGAMSNPAWSPDGRSIAFSGLDGGLSDLYVLDVATSSVRQLTNDRYADLQPNWSPDGQSIVFVTDRGPGGTNFETLSYGNMRLATINVAGGEIQVINPFPRALNHNPVYSPDGRSLFFISDQDGFKDVYRYALDNGQIFRVTNLKTGVSGITNTSPAMSVAMQSGRMVFSVYANDDYNVYSLEPNDLRGTALTPTTEGIASAGVLPPLRAVNEGIVGNYLDDPLTGLPPANTDFPVKDYKTRLRLDYVAPPTVGASVGGPFGTRVGGGVGFFFSDMLGNHNLTVVAQANGTVKDIGGQVQYVNQASRFNYGLAAGHIPLLYGYSSGAYDPTTGTQYIQQVQQRIYIEQLSGIGAYPFSTTRRAEISGGFVRYAFDYDVETYAFDQFGGYNRNRENLDAPPATYFFQASAAYVGDYSTTGFTSPIAGGRFRFSVTPMAGTETFVTVLGDYRRYFYLKPFTFAMRGLHIGNYGAQPGNNNGGFDFGTEYLGSVYYPGFVRGYSFGSITADECNVDPGCYDRLMGTRIGLASAELRVPLLGPDVLALINFPYLPTEVSFFGDAGMAWNGADFPQLKFKSRPTPEERVPVFSAGVSSRFNIFGYMVLEVFYAYPFQRPERGAHWGLQLSPGW